MSAARRRFAPSPTGYLHIGHALSAILNQRAARADGGQFLLRVEDIDTTRCRAHFVSDICADLAWLGLEWPQPVRFQSQCRATYAHWIAQLACRGFLYESRASRAELKAACLEARARGCHWPADPQGAPRFPPRASPEGQALEACAKRPWNAAANLRLDMHRALDAIGHFPGWTEQAIGNDGQAGRARQITADPASWGDVIVARQDIGASYHLCVVVDDMAQDIGHVIRGADLRAATSVHRVLQELLGFDAPVYSHHRLVRDGAQRKLSKSEKVRDLRALRAGGTGVAEIYQRLGLESGPIHGTTQEK